MKIRSLLAAVALSASALFVALPSSAPVQAIGGCSAAPISPQGAKATCWGTGNPDQIRAYVGCTSWSWPGQVRYSYGFWAYSSSAQGSWVQCPSGAVRQSYGYQGRNV